MHSQIQKYHSCASNKDSTINFIKPNCDSCDLTHVLIAQVKWNSFLESSKTNCTDKKPKNYVLNAWRLIHSTIYVHELSISWQAMILLIWEANPCGDYTTIFLRLMYSWSQLLSLLITSVWNQSPVVAHEKCPSSFSPKWSVNVMFSDESSAQGFILCLSFICVLIFNTPASRLYVGKSTFVCFSCSILTIMSSGQNDN